MSDAIADLKLLHIADASPGQSPDEAWAPYELVRELGLAFLMSQYNGTPEYTQLESHRRIEFEGFVASGDWGSTVEMLKVECLRAGVVLPDSVLGEIAHFGVQLGEPLTEATRQRLEVIYRDIHACWVRAYAASGLKLGDGSASPATTQGQGQKPAATHPLLLWAGEQFVPRWKRMIEILLPVGRTVSYREAKIAVYGSGDANKRTNEAIEKVVERINDRLPEANESVGDTYKIQAHDSNKLTLVKVPVVGRDMQPLDGTVGNRPRKVS